MTLQIFILYFLFNKKYTKIAPKQIIKALYDAESAIVVYCDRSPHSAKKVSVKDCPNTNFGVKSTPFFFFSGGLSGTNFI